MELDQFVTETLTQIMKGVNNARNSEEINGKDIHPEVTWKASGGPSTSNRKVIHNIDFDVAVTATDGDSSKAKIGVVSGIFNAGAEGQTEKKNSSVTRIKFSVPVIYPS